MAKRKEKVETQTEGYLNVSVYNPRTKQFQSLKFGIKLDSARQLDAELLEIARSANENGNVVKPKVEASIWIPEMQETVEVDAADWSDFVQEG